MKEKVFIFIIGLLIGAIITTGACYLYIKSSYANQSPQMPGGQIPQMSGQPPEKPNGDNMIEMPNDNNNQNEKIQNNN